MSGSGATRPIIGVGVLIWRDRQILLGKRIAQGQQSCWQFPGGHLEHGESVIDCARREVLEETSLKISAPRHLGFTDTAFSIGSRQYITLLVTSEYGSGEAKTLEPDKCERWQWFDYRQLPEPLFQPITIFLSQSMASQQGDLYALHCTCGKVQDAPANLLK